MRSFTAQSLIALPVLSAPQAAALATQLETHAKGHKLSPEAAEALRDLVAARGALEAVNVANPIGYLSPNDGTDSSHQPRGQSARGTRVDRRIHTLPSVRQDGRGRTGWSSRRRSAGSSGILLLCRRYASRDVWTPLTKYRG